MTLPSFRRPVASVAVLAANVIAGMALLSASPAWAQVGMGMPGQTMNPAGAARQFQGPNGSNPPKPVIQPEAVPGAKSSFPAAPATRPANDMSPTDALFDAINRGDIAAARDAVNRGADLGAQNILGMTPMELSVDLGRNDISFLMLSMRTEDKPAPAAADQTASVPINFGAVGRAGPAVKTAAAKRPRTGSVKSAQAAAPQAPSAPRLFANDGGTPNPAAGFLGFDLGTAH